MSWETQGRQEHGWFGHGTAPDETKGVEPAAPGSLFDPLSVGQRIGYASGGVVSHSPRDERSRWEARVGGTNLEHLKTAIAVWYGASSLTRDTFRQQMLDPATNDKTVDRLRNAAKGIVEAQTHAQLNAAGVDLATAAQAIGLDRWPCFLANAAQRGAAAVSAGTVPGVVKASATGADMGVGVIVGTVLLLVLGAKVRNAGPARPSVMPEAPAAISPISPTDDKSGTASEAKPSADENAQLAPGPDGVDVSDQRRKYILNGNEEGTGGGHGPGRNLPNKSEFPSGWSDDKITDTIKEVGNDPKSSRSIEPDGRIKVTGTRDGIDIKVIVEPDRRTVVSAYPTNTPRNPKRER